MTFLFCSTAFLSSPFELFPWTFHRDDKNVGTFYFAAGDTYKAQKDISNCRKWGIDCQKYWEIYIKHYLNC